MKKNKFAMNLKISVPYNIQSMKGCWFDISNKWLFSF